MICALLYSLVSWCHQHNNDLYWLFTQVIYFKSSITIWHRYGYTLYMFRLFLGAGNNLTLPPLSIGKRICNYHQTAAVHTLWIYYIQARLANIYIHFFHNPRFITLFEFVFKAHFSCCNKKKIISQSLWYNLCPARSLVYSLINSLVYI